MLITEAEKDLSCVLFFFFQPKTFIQCVYKILWHIYGCNIELESKADLRDDYLNPFGSVGDDERLQKVLFFFGNGVWCRFSRISKSLFALCMGITLA